MMGELQILPGTGRGTVRRTVEGGSLPTRRCGWAMAPSVSGVAAATSPHVGRIVA